MSNIQNQLAFEVLDLIQKANQTNTLLTYTGVAKQLGRTADHARAVAQACDLLDAAAALARVPLLALVAVRSKNLEINPKAFVKETLPGVREAIINKSLMYPFSESDFRAIGESLNLLKDLGNRAAWREVSNKIQNIHEVLSSPLTDVSHSASNDAINDLGADIVGKYPTQGSSYARDSRVRKAVEVRAQGKCEYCGEEGFVKTDGTNYLETHHIVALSNDGSDRVKNVIALCANHHRQAHYSENKENLEKQMVEIVLNKYT